jgi:hypothetical protein
VRSKQEDGPDRLDFYTASDLELGGIMLRVAPKRPGADTESRGFIEQICKDSRRRLLAMI